MRLTQKNEFFEYVLPEQNTVGDNQATEVILGETEYTCKKYIIGEAIKELGEPEDVLEEFELTSAEDLRNYLNFKGNMAIWEGKLELKNKIADLEQELAELKQKAIVPKFKIGQEVFIIIQDVIRATSINSFRVFENNELSCYCKYVDGERMYLELDEEEIFATKEEAEQSLLNALEDK